MALDGGGRVRPAAHRLLRRGRIAAGVAEVLGSRRCLRDEAVLQGETWGQEERRERSE